MWNCFSYFDTEYSALLPNLSRPHFIDTCIIAWCMMCSGFCHISYFFHSSYFKYAALRVSYPLDSIRFLEDVRSRHPKIPHVNTPPPPLTDIVIIITIRIRRLFLFCICIQSYISDTILVFIGPLNHHVSRILLHYFDYEAY